MTAPVYLLVQGMHLRADSIAYDAAFQYRLFQRWGIPVEVFVETFDGSNYPGIDAHPLPELAAALKRAPGTVIYHWVDGWRAGDELLVETDAPVVLRWHNNTPPWFFASHSPVPTHKTVRGFLELLRVAEALPRARIWTNSEFSRRQLSVLGIAEERIEIVYPASSYLEDGADEPGADAPRPATHAPRTEASPIRLLFVGRVVPHKGHLHLIAAASAVAEMSGREVCVVLPGRPDGDMTRYVPEVKTLGDGLGVTVEVPGEVSHDDLERAYREADVFVGLSEHEGFGLPILEAMTRRLPVVGYRCAAVAELLDTHPLAVDELDPIEIARRILAALEPDARRALVDWQVRAVLPRFSTTVINEQLRRHLAREGYHLPETDAASQVPLPESAADPAPKEVWAALERAKRLPKPTGDLPRDLPRDINPHYVTRWDLASYRTLLSRGENGDLRGRALSLRFGSHRGTLGGVMGLLKRGVLRLQDGLIRTIEMSHNDLEDQLKTVHQRVDALSTEVSKLRADTRRDRSS